MCLYTAHIPLILWFMAVNNTQPNEPPGRGLFCLLMKTLTVTIKHPPRFDLLLVLISSSAAKISLSFKNSPAALATLRHVQNTRNSIC